MHFSFFSSIKALKHINIFYLKYNVMIIKLIEILVLTFIGNVAKLFIDNHKVRLK